MNNILVVVDYQYDFVEGELGFPKAKTLEDGIYHKVREALAQKTAVFFTRDSHGEHYEETREGRHLPVRHCLTGSDGAKLYGRVGEFEGCDGVYMVEKDNFGSDRLAEVIERAVGMPDNIGICGLVTNMCVISNAILLQTAFSNANITVYSSLCAGYDDVLHQKALDIMGSVHMHIV